MSYMERDQQPFYTRFKDKALSAAQKRGVQRVGWEDVFSVATDFGETRSVLADQEISPTGLKRDIQYSLYFGRPAMIEGALEPLALPDVYSQAVSELQHDIDGFIKTQDFLTEPMARATSMIFLGYLKNYLEDRGKAIADPQALHVAQIKSKLLEETLDGFIVNFKPIFPTPEETSLPEEFHALMEGANDMFTIQVLEQFHEYALQKNKVVLTNDNPILIYDLMDKTDGRIAGALTPYQLIDAAQKTSDSFLRYVLYRNGMAAPEGYEAPCSMPPPTIIVHALSALGFVQEHRQKDVTVTHLLPGLLQDPEVLRLLMDLDEERNLSEKEESSPMGMIFGKRGAFSRNFVRFYNVIQTHLAPQQEGLDSFRFRPVITEELRDFLLQAEGAVTNGPRGLAGARLFGELLKQKDVRTLLFKAGLTSTQLRRWPKVLRDADKKKVKEETTIKDKTEIAFKVDDKELEDLLEEYGSERSKLALEGKLDPIIGREEEIGNMIRILLQRGKANPLLLGENGVGKTVLFDGLAQRIASGNVPRSLVGARVIALDLSAMNSGAVYRGQFEARLLPVVQGVAERNAKGDKPPIILCIDEIHAALQAGSAQNTPGASELLKPPLARGEISVVGATTQADYAKYIEVDAALNRRFEAIFVNAPGYEQTVAILSGLKEAYGKYHGIEFPDTLLPTLVRLTDRYLPNLNQPDKAISVLDAAYARARMQEKIEVDQGTIIDTIAAVSKLDPRFLQDNEGSRYLKLKEDLPQEVLGQEEGVKRIAEALIVAKADLHDPKKPLGQFLLMGPTGVGKTETARALARLLFGSEEALIRIDMSNMREAHEDSRLFGTTPGFIGYGEEGELTGAVRRKPNAVVLLDEVEKAHPEVFKRLLPIFEEGEVRDGRNQVISFRNTVILMTSNLGVEEAYKQYKRRDALLRRDETWKKLAYPEFEKAAKERFAPEFLNRLDGQIIYGPLSQEVIHTLVGRELSAVAERLQQRWGLTLDVPQSVYEQLATEGYNDEYGARHLKRVVATQLITPLASWVLENESAIIEGGTLDVSGLGSSLAPKIRTTESSQNTEAS